MIRDIKCGIYYIKNIININLLFIMYPTYLCLHP